MTAESLVKTKKEVDSLSKDDFLRFLSQPGSAPIHALTAVFQPHQFWYWEERKGRLFRRQPREGYIDLQHQFNITEGPHHRCIMSRFNNKQVIDETALTFINELFPKERKQVKNCCYRLLQLVRAPIYRKQPSMFVPGTAYMCHIPFLHNDLRVLLALLDCPNLDIFSTQGCLAIIALKWRKEKTLARFRMYIAGFECAAFMAINFITDETTTTDEAPFVPAGSMQLFVTNVVCLLIWFVAMSMEVAQILGYVCTGLTKRYFASTRHWLDVVAVLMTGAVNIALLQLNQEATYHVAFATSLGILVFMKWLRFLVYLRQIRAIGIQILPITETMWDIGPFLIVLIIYLIATVNMFFALNNKYTFGECFMLIYRLVVWGDATVSELENRAATPMILNLANGEITKPISSQTDTYYVVQVMMVIFSFIIGVSLMNLFLAMLCVSYTTASEMSSRSFMKSRLSMVLDQHATRVGVARLCCCPSHSTAQMVYGSTNSEYDISQSNSALRSSSTSATKLPDAADVSRKAFLWYTVQTSFESPS